MAKKSKYKSEAGRKLLRSLLSQCSPGEIGMFCRIYVSVDIIQLADIPNAIRLCEETIHKNNKKKIMALISPKI